MLKFVSKIVFCTTVLASGTSFATESDCILAKHINLGGHRWEARARELGAEAPNMGGFNDKMSSVWVKNGYKITIYFDDNYQGYQFTLYGDGSNTQPVPRRYYNPMTSGLNYTDGVYYNLAEIGWNDEMSSFRCEVDF